MNWFQSMTAAPKPPRNINNKQLETRTNGGEKLMRARTEVYFWVFFIAWRVGPGRHGYDLRGGPPEFPRTNSFSASCRPWAEAAWQPCGNTGENQETKINDAFLSTTILVIYEYSCLWPNQCFWNIFKNKFQKLINFAEESFLFVYFLSHPIKSLAILSLFDQCWRGSDLHAGTNNNAFR